MAKVKSPAIGTVPCPWASCKETAEVRKFATTASLPGRARFGGKLYADCPRHGRFGSTGSADFQDYILEHATLYGPEGAPTREPEKQSVDSECPNVRTPPAPVAPVVDKGTTASTGTAAALPGRGLRGSGLLID